MVNNFYQFSAGSLQGKETGMATCEGKVALVENTPSKRGITPQYADFFHFLNIIIHKGIQ